MTVDAARVKARAEARPPEEVEAGTDDPIAQAGAILAESDAREVDRVDPPGQPVEHRRSEDTVELPAAPDDPDDQAPNR